MKATPVLMFAASYAIPIARTARSNTEPSPTFLAQPSHFAWFLVGGKIIKGLWRYRQVVFFDKTVLVQTYFCGSALSILPPLAILLHMFISASNREKNGKTHTYHRVMEKRCIAAAPQLPHQPPPKIYPGQIATLAPYREVPNPRVPHEFMAQTFALGWAPGPFLVPKCEGWANTTRHRAGWDDHYMLELLVGQAAQRQNATDKAGRQLNRYRPKRSRRSEVNAGPAGV